MVIFEMFFSLLRNSVLWRICELLQQYFAYNLLDFKITVSNSKLNY